MEQHLKEIGAKLERMTGILEQMLAAQMYATGAGQREIAESLGISLGKVNRLVKGVKPPKAAQ